MNILEQCVQAFEKIFYVNYHFQISKSKNLLDLTLEFEKSDFKHLVGLQNLRDIAMSRNSEKVFDDIKNNKIKYAIIEKSDFYYNSNDSYADVSSRMNHFPQLAEYIENENLVLKYVKKRNPYSKIDADYVIESTIDEVTVYLFLRQKSNGNYCVCSFFLKDKVQYAGEPAYWMLKEKIDLTNNMTEIIYERVVDTNLSGFCILE